jgi:4-hydroxy-tetrahydrodipicolinate reductase
MNILLAGYGRMGRMVEAAAADAGHRVVAAVDPHAQTDATATGAPILRSMEDAASLTAEHAADVAVEFTGPASAFENIKALAGMGLSVVCGSTGWYERLDEAAAFIKGCGGALIWSSNFSPGVNLFYRIVERAARLAAAFPDYDIAGFELHHNKKADSPSGTAKTIASIIADALPSKGTPVYDKLERPPEPGELHFASLRCGSAPGMHTVIFDSPADTIELRHTARTRAGFASGAIRAALWLTTPTPRPGVWTMDDFLADILVERGWRGMGSRERGNEE